MDYSVCIEGVTKTFGSFTALDGVDLNIQKGELICFLGPSGCGKTTLLRIIAGLEQQSAGRILQNGRDVSRLPTSERDFGIVFQSYALFPNLTVVAHIGYGLVNRKVSKVERNTRVDELLMLIGLDGSGPKYPSQLSGGQQQRVALARALATSPSLLLLDEPLSALDARVRQHLRSEIRRLQQRLGVTTILVTHDQEEALTMADRIVVMNHGVIEQVGPPEQVYAAPRTRFAAEFLGAMSFLRGRVTAIGLVDLYGMKVACDTRHLPIGADVDLAVRPEDVNLFPESADSEGLVGSVMALEFLGSSLRAKVRLEASKNETILCDLTRREASKQSMAIGSRCRVKIASGSAVAFPC